MSSPRWSCGCLLPYRGRTDRKMLRVGRCIPTVEAPRFGMGRALVGPGAAKTPYSRNVIERVARGGGGSGDLGSSWQQAATDLGAHAPRGGDLTSPHSSIADIDGEVCLHFTSPGGGGHGGGAIRVRGAILRSLYSIHISVSWHALSRVSVSYHALSRVSCHALSSVSVSCGARRPDGSP